MQRFGQYSSCHPMTASSIQGRELKEVLAKMGGAPGMEGWHVAELKMYNVIRTEIMSTGTTLSVTSMDFFLNIIIHI